MKRSYKILSSLLLMFAMTASLGSAYASGHEAAKGATKMETETYQLVADYLGENETTSAYETYTFYNEAAEKVAEFKVEESISTDHPELNKMLRSSSLLLSDKDSKTYLVD